MGVWSRYCDTGGKPAGNREDKHAPNQPEELIYSTLADIQASLPEGMKIESHIFRQADFISVSIDNLLEALGDGAILVIAIVFIFLASGRATAITLVALPRSLLAAVLVLKAMGATINTITLGGLAIALGALVDDAIIVVENIVRRMRENQQRPEEQQTQGHGELIVL